MRSYARGPDLSLPDVTTSRQLELTANRFPDRLALVSCHQNRRLTWRELLLSAGSLASGLAALGILAGDRVGIWAMSCYEWVIVYLACARLGAVLVTVNPACRSYELAFILTKSRMRILFLRERDERTNYAEILTQVRRDNAASEPPTQLERTVVFGSEEWARALASQPRPPFESAIDDVANIQYTSGTTGSPKGVLLTHRNLLNNAFLVAQALGYTEHDRICVPVPLSHCFGSVLGILTAVVSGAAIILPDWRFQPATTLAAVDAERATSLYGVPTMFIAELGHPDFSRFQFPELRTGLMAAAPCPVEVVHQVITRMHCPELTIGYGLTETSPIITMSAADDTFEHRATTVGNVLPCTELKVVSLETGETVERGVQGEICARGYLVMKGYDGEPEATARAIDPDGWFHTGDLGAMREDGYLNITGRAKDMIIRGGENIYPREVEEFLYTHPKIAEIQVTGIPDERLGEIVVAWIRLKTGETATAEEIRAFCAGRIASFKIPERIRFVDSFPTTLSGKIQKFRMREIEMCGQPVPARVTA
jgi:fatty-acyl-CoA synthase